MAAACAFPNELLATPLGFVALTGLDVSNNAMHKAIWDTFTVSRRADKVLNIALIPGDSDFPKPKPKRATYEFYQPKGIFKTNWINKHLHVIPALVVIFFDLDWDDPQWEERQVECASKVATMRASLQGRNTRIAIVIIHKNTPMLPGEDIPAAERANSLCEACELSNKSLFVLPFGEHLHGYVTRLENVFYDISLGYYTNESRHIKAHREYLRKPQHLFLYVRHQFKIAFFSELKQDLQAALKHYKQAYANVLEIKLTDINNLEVKMASGFILYKICKMSFNCNAPLEAISQFRKHIDYFKDKDGISNLAFEHSSWMAKQFSLFGDLFKEAIRKKLQAIQTQHPGFYYQQAAVHSMIRRQLCKSLCKFSESVKPDPLEGADKMEYFGQRPWRKGCQSAEPPDMTMESAGILSLQAQELAVDHAWIIIPLLSGAVAQFREYKSVRMKQHLMVQMGEEYSHSKDYNKALSMLNRVTGFYRSERWWPLLTHILMISLRCAHLTASVLDYVVLSLEIIGQNSEIARDEKERIQNNLTLITKNQVPQPERNCDPPQESEAESLWKTWSETITDPVKVEMGNIAGCVECRICFDSEKYYADQRVELKLFVRSSALLGIDISKVSVIFNNTLYNQVLTNADDVQSPLATIESGIVKYFTMSFIPSGDDVGKNIEVTQIIIQLGQNVYLHWNGVGIDAYFTGVPPVSPYHQTIAALPCAKFDQQGHAVWKTIRNRPHTEILSRQSLLRLDIDSGKSCLIGEQHRIEVSILNEEPTAIKDLRLILSLNEAKTAKNDPSRLLIPNDNDLSKPLEETDIVEREVKILDVNDKYEIPCFIRSNATGTINIRLKATYHIELQKDDGAEFSCFCTVEKDVSLQVVSPFKIKTIVTNMDLDPISSINVDTCLLSMAELECSSPHPIQVHDTRFALTDQFSMLQKDRRSQLADVSLRQGDEARECCAFKAAESCDNGSQISLGSFLIAWKRVSASANDSLVHSSVPLPNVKIASLPFVVEADVPAFGSVCDVMPVSYIIHNRTDLVQEVEVALQHTDKFLYAGNSEIQFRILPRDKHVLEYAMVPLAAGEITLPLLRISLPRYHSVNVDTILQKRIPSVVFVKPSGRQAVTVE